MKRTDSIAVHTFGLTLTSFAFLHSLAAIARRAPSTARHAIKPLALWLNAARYKVSEEEIDWLNYTRKRMYQLALVDGPDARYYIRCGMELEAQEHQQRLLQRKLRARRDRINQW